MFNSLDNRYSFLRPSYTLTSAAEAFLDPLITVVTLLLTTLLHGEAVSPGYVVLSALVFSLGFPGSIPFNEPTTSLLRKIFISWAIQVCILGIFGYATGLLSYFPREILIGWIICTPFTLFAAHLLARQSLLHLLKGKRQRTAIIAGVNEVGLRLAQQFHADPYLGVRIVGYFDDRNLERLPDTNGLPTIGRMTELAEFVKLNRIDHIYLSLPMASQPRILSLLDDLKDTTASIFFVPDIFVTDLIQGQLHSVGNTPVVAVCETPFTGFRGLVKRLSDIALSSVFLVLLAPIMAALAIGVKLSSPGPVIFKQRRYGLDGKEILVYKFRSMTTCDNGAVVKQATKNDQRITPFGAFIRKTSLDELPQFVNVLQGRMSIVGPRPHAVAHNETYRKLVKGYMIRHKVKPGITGWAQVCGYRGETETIDKMEKRIEYDLEYLRNWSLSFDLWIIFRTVAVVIKDKNAY